MGRGGGVHNDDDGWSTVVRAACALHGGSGHYCQSMGVSTVRCGGCRVESGAVLYPMPGDPHASAEAVRAHMAELRRATIASITLMHMHMGPHGAPHASPAGPSDMKPSNDRQEGEVGGRSPRTNVRLDRVSASSARGTGSGRDSVSLQRGSFVGGGEGASGGARELSMESMTARLQVLQWDRDVAALCEAVSQDAGTSAQVKQQAGALLAALAVAPAASAMQAQPQPVLGSSPPRRAHHDIFTLI